MASSPDSDPARSEFLESFEQNLATIRLRKFGETVRSIGYMIAAILASAHLALLMFGIFLMDSEHEEMAMYTILALFQLPVSYLMCHWFIQSSSRYDGHVAKETKLLSLGNDYLQNRDNA